VLSAEQYAPAEVIYRSFLPGAQWPESGTNVEYCLAFGHYNSTVPADFMKRFVGVAPRVFTGTNGLIFQPGVRLDPTTGRQVVMVTIDSLSFRDDAAQAWVFYIGPSTVASEELQLARQGVVWRVIKRKEETRTYF
jgi:hypothetical protein